MLWLAMFATGLKIAIEEVVGPTCQCVALPMINEAQVCPRKGWKNSIECVAMDQVESSGGRALYWLAIKVHRYLK